jgi:hypothetical protein
MRKLLRAEMTKCFFAKRIRRAPAERMYTRNLDALHEIRVKQVPQFLAIQLPLELAPLISTLITTYPTSGPSLRKALEDKRKREMVCAPKAP